MNDEQIVEYCRKMITANLSQYMDESPKIIGGTLYELQGKKTKERNKLLLEHCIGLKALLEKAIEILERKD